MINVFHMSHSQIHKSCYTSSGNNTQYSLTVLMDFSLVSSRKPLLFELVRGLLSAIDGAWEPLPSLSSSIVCKFNCGFVYPISPIPNGLLKSEGVPLPSMHVWSFFLKALRFLCFRVLKLVPHFLLFRFMPTSIVGTALWLSFFMCASRAPSISLSLALYF